MDILDCSFLCKEMATDAVFGANHRCGEVQVLFLGRITVMEEADNLPNRKINNKIVFHDI